MYKINRWYLQCMSALREFLGPWYEQIVTLNYNVTLTQKLGTVASLFVVSIWMYKFYSCCLQNITSQRVHWGWEDSCQKEDMQKGIKFLLFLHWKEQRWKYHFYAVYNSIFQYTDNVIKTLCRCYMYVCCVAWQP